MGPPFGVDGS